MAVRSRRSHAGNARGAARARSVPGRRRRCAGSIRAVVDRGVRRARGQGADRRGGAAMSATVFDTPLDARALVEASAGTGKTFALAGLFARGVIVARLRVPQGLAVTYTIAATQELHERVRRRLQAATALARD